MLFLLKLECACKQGREGVRGEASDRWDAEFPLPASHTLIVLSVMPPLTILDPSGENWTEEIEPIMLEVCAFCFSLIKVSESVGKRER